MAYSTGATDLALDFIKQKIHSGEWAEGTRIPTEDQLCSQLDLSRISVRQAIEKLASLSVLTKIQGSGTYVNTASESSIMGLTFYPMTRERIRMVLEFRRMFDPHNTQLFIRNASAHDLEALDENYYLMERAGREGCVDLFHLYDHEFHDIIARGTNNMIIIQISELLTGLLRYYHAEERHSLGFNHAMKYHKLILEAIHEGNEELASIYCRIHIDNALQQLKKDMSMIEEAAP